MHAAVLGPPFSELACPACLALLHSILATRPLLFSSRLARGEYARSLDCQEEIGKRCTRGRSHQDRSFQNAVAFTHPPAAGPLSRVVRQVGCGAREWGTRKMRFWANRRQPESWSSG